MKPSPRPGQVYTYEQIMNDLELRDRPSLGFAFNEQSQVVQTSHLFYEEIIQVDGWFDSRWVFMYETDEWIPVFSYAGVPCISELVDMEPYLDPYDEKPGRVWATPKGLGRRQYYSRTNVNGRPMLKSPGGELYPLPRMSEPGENIHYYLRPIKIA